jgi:hypothetical protein
MERVPRPVPAVVVDAEHDHGGASAQFLNSDESSCNYMMATAVIYALPPVAIYYAFRRRMASGLTMPATRAAVCVNSFDKRIRSFGVSRVALFHSIHTGCFSTLLSTGTFRKRLPVAAKIALATAGTIAEVPASPIPPGGSELWTMWTSMAGASFMRRIW